MPPAPHDPATAPTRPAPNELAVGGAAMVHEVRNVLTAVRGWVELGRSADPALAARAWGVIEDGIARAIGLLDGGARPRGEVQSFSLDEVAHRVADLLEASCVAEGLALRREITPITAYGDAERVAQIALNFGLNALQAMKEKGSALTIATRGDAAHALLLVEDDGPGMSEAARAALFDPFAAPRSEGGRVRGLGLTVCRALAESMAAGVDAQSTVGQGSVMSLSLRRSRHPRAFSDVPATEPALRVGMRVLVLDDEAAIRELLEVALTLRGARVLGCDDPEEARRLTLSGEVDVALVDETLGGSLRGSALLAELSELAPSVGRVLMTGAAETAGLAAAAHARLVRKPFLLEDVVRALTDADPC